MCGGIQNGRVKAVRGAVGLYCVVHLIGVVAGLLNIGSRRVIGNVWYRGAGVSLRLVCLSQNVGLSV